MYLKNRYIEVERMTKRSPISFRSERERDLTLSFVFFLAHLRRIVVVPFDQIVFAENDDLTFSISTLERERELRGEGGGEDLPEPIRPEPERCSSPGRLRIVVWPRRWTVRATIRRDLDIEWSIDRRE